MRRHLKKLLPDHAIIRENRYLRPFANSLLHPRLWHLNRHSAAGAVAAGLFCGLIPGPFQMLGAALCALAFRVNLPLALFTTLYTNPLTIVPLYVIAFEMGNLAIGNGSAFIAPPEFAWSEIRHSLQALLHWIISLGQPLALGLLLLAGSLAAIGYVLT
ncbi:MAG TPA: DUF2062 domain-containing protein, partial [Rhodocyclaceae bacterium]|nr:DUF2062 domain-containing protein [Rhodocyclaceae bacterium]